MYYTNLYGNSDYDTIIETGQSLFLHGYNEISKVYLCGLNKEYSKEEYMITLSKIDVWIQDNEDIIFSLMSNLFYRVQWVCGLN